MNLISPNAFKWTLSILTTLGSLWALYDVVLVAKLRGADRRDPLVRDKLFGYAIGILLGILGLVGVLRYNGVV
ncbi:MAG: hypothetical protein ACTHU0_00100 [Kofleriaceae bacterium]